VPPNVRFEIDDCTQPWTWPENTFDFIHMRYLFGSISDWSALIQEAYTACAPGGWVQTAEVEVDYISDDGTVKPDSAMAMWGHMCRVAGPKMGRPFTILRDGLQRKGMEEAGFVDIHEVNFKVLVGSRLSRKTFPLILITRSPWVDGPSIPSWPRSDVSCSSGLRTIWKVSHPHT